MGTRPIWLGLETMSAYRSVPPWDIIDSQILAFRGEIAAVGAGLVGAAGDDTLPFWAHCRGADVLLRGEAGTLVKFLGKVGDHRLSKGHRQAARLVREFLAGEALPPDAPEDWLEQCQAWQRRALDCKRGLREAAQVDLARRERTGKNRQHLELRVAVPEPEPAVA